MLAAAKRWKVAFGAGCRESAYLLRTRHVYAHESVQGVLS